MNEEDGFGIGALLQPGEIARDPERELTDVEIARPLRQGGGRRAAEGKAVLADPSQNSGRAMGTSPLNPVHRGGWRGLTPDPSGNPAIAVILFRLVVFAPMNGNPLHDVARRRGRDRARPERGQHDCKSVLPRGVEKMAGEGEVNPIDPVRRKVQHARGEPRNVERNGDNHHLAFKRAPDGGIGLREILHN